MTVWPRMLSPTLECFLSMMLEEIIHLLHMLVQPLTHQLFLKQENDPVAILHGMINRLSCMRPRERVCCMVSPAESVYAQRHRHYIIWVFVYMQQWFIAMGHLTTCPEGKPSMYMDILVCSRPYKQLLFSFVASSPHPPHESQQESAVTSFPCEN